jgi:uncharacterized protein YqgC (DUF456 family)
MIYLGLALLIIALVAGWVLTLFNLPGNWVIVIAAALFAWLSPDDGRFDIGWWVVAVLLGLALLGELVEFAAGAVGAARVGGSKRGAILAMIGSIVGGLTGAVMGLPIPVVGSIVAALLFAGLGALAGAMLGEAWKGRNLDESWRIGQAAFWGRLMGTLAKTIIGSVMAITCAIAAIL